jgi:hypothetical protein
MEKKNQGVSASAAWPASRLANREHPQPANIPPSLPTAPPLANRRPIARRAESVGKMLDRYHHHDQEYNYAAPSSRRAHADGRPGRPSAAPTPEELARFLNRPRPSHGHSVA